MTSALAAATAPAPGPVPTQKQPKMYAHQLVNELEEVEIQLTVSIKDRPLRELDALDELVDVRFLTPFRAGWSVLKARGGREAVYRARRIKVAQLEAMYRALAVPRLSTLHVAFPAHLAAHVLPRLAPSADALQLARVPANAAPELAAFLRRCHARGTRVLLLESKDEVAFAAVKHAFSISRYEFEGRYTRVVLDAPAATATTAPPSSASASASASASVSASVSAGSAPSCVIPATP